MIFARVHEGRRPLASIAVLAGSLCLATSLAAPATAQGAVEPPSHTDLLPDFAFTDEPLTALDWDPTGERIFPSVIRAADYLDEPLGEYYMYYAPHESPGGIALAYADDLDGPWTEYEANPLVSNRWEPHYAVSHVSSPHVIWNEDEEQFFLFFHGENDVTRFATSTDGVSWTYGDAAIRTDSTTGHESSYARVYEYRVEGMDNRYVMTFMDNVEFLGIGEKRRIRWATSDDMRSWEIQPEPLVRATSQNRENVSGAYLLTWNGRTVVVHHGSDGDMWASEVGPALDQDVPLGRVHEAMDTAPDSGRSAAPTFYLDGREFHVFYEAGSRLSATIGHAKGALRPSDDVTRELECAASPSVISGTDGRWVDVTVGVDLPDGTLGPRGFELVDVDPGWGSPFDVAGFEVGSPDTKGEIRARPTSRLGRTVTLTYAGRDEIGRPAECTVEIEITRDWDHRPMKEPA